MALQWDSSSILSKLGMRYQRNWIRIQLNELEKLAFLYYTSSASDFLSLNTNLRIHVFQSIPWLVCIKYLLFFQVSDTISSIFLTVELILRYHYISTSNQAFQQHYSNHYYNLRWGLLATIFVKGDDGPFFFSMFMTKRHCVDDQLE